ncbi:putative outer membrane porin protein [Pragia fontium]|uniref:Outer membrane porin, OprD family n=2 Tax=Pragia fontium TaxID=82985 RepID=A0AAJ5BIH8_9GAMM|nr:OprD family outer membrane porin [Pragia fontium]GKX64216.1 hypothetical protein SOASR032_27850 [Pragia fontium]SFD36805.1 outer membrane porin, OprD family [Pragia fontium DSM 5563 = ATCC 49100]SUB84006.1 putative outer membrane porin protein [Pragia fontium]
MRINTLHKLSVALLTSALLPLSAYAESQKNDTTPEFLADFVNNSQLDFSLRNVFKNLNTSDYGERSVQTAWGQGFTLDYRSGYLADMIGVDASYYSVLKLANSDEFYGRSVLYNDNGEAKGFNKMGQIYGKFRLGDDDTYFHLYSGWKELRKWGALNISTRAIPSSYLGWSAEAGTGPLRLRGAYVTRYTDRDSPEKVHFRSADRKRQISNISTADVKYQLQDYSALYFWGESHDYMRRQGLELEWKPSTMAGNKLRVTSLFYLNQGLDNWTEMSTSHKTFNKNAYHYALMAQWQADRWKHKVGASYTVAKLDDGLGRFEWHLAKNSRGTFNSMADSWGNDYVGHKEKMIAWTPGYAVTPEIEVGAVTNYGWGMKYKGVSIDRGETLLYTRWAPVDGKLKNLSVQLSGGPSWNFQSKRNKPILNESQDKALLAQNHSIELQIDYKFKIF